MVSQSRKKSFFAAFPRRATPQTRRSRLQWTLGNLLLVAGLYLLAFVGGLYVQIEYNRQAARGDNDLPVLAAPAVVPVSQAAAPAGMSNFTAPVLSNGQVASAIPSAEQAAHAALVERLVIPSIGVDSKVVEVGWSVQAVDGQEIAVWDVAEFAVGQHKGSANPGEGGNVVLAGHVGGYGKVFKDLYYVEPGDQITIYSAGRQFLYLVRERVVVDEENASAAQRAINALYMAATPSEVVTMITCWPATGPDRYSQRVIVRAVPYGAAGTPAAQNDGGPSSWTVR